MAIDSVNTRSPSTSTGTRPAGLIFRNSSVRLSPFWRSTLTLSKGTSSSCNTQRGRIERVGANSYSTISASFADGSVDPPDDPKGILQGCVAISPEHIRRWHRAGATRFDRTIKPRVHIFHHQSQAVTRVLPQRMPMLRVRVAQHERASVDVQMNVHRATALIHRDEVRSFSGKSLFVKTGRLGGTVNGQIGDQAAFRLRIRGHRGSLLFQALPERRPRTPRHDTNSKNFKYRF